MRTALFFDQIQAGQGGKERPNVELDVKKGGIGSYRMFERYAKEEGLSVLATMYAGHEYFFENEEESKEKIAKLLDKLKIKLLICGPTYDYDTFAQMAVKVAEYVNENSNCKAIVCCAERKNEALIEEYKDRLVMVKMPRKGGVGLNQSLHNMIKVGKAYAEGDLNEELKKLTYE